MLIKGSLADRFPSAQSLIARRFLLRLLPLLLTVAWVWSSASFAEARIRQRKTHAPLLEGMPVSGTSWLSAGVWGAQRMELGNEQLRPLLQRYLEPFRNHTPAWQGFLLGTYGPRKSWLPTLCWERAACAESESASEPLTTPLAWSAEARLTLALLEPRLQRISAPTLDVLLPWLPPPPAPELLNISRRAVCPRWKAPLPVTVLRYAGEGMRAPLTDCDGAIAPDVLDELSVLARPAGAARPALPLPLEPSGEGGEWTDEVRLLEPRMVWLLTEVARAFPGRAIVLMSGYRRDGHSGNHGKGRALDLYVQGVPNAELFKVCRTLRDVGCGFYPRNQFVHLDVRPYGTGRVAWVDISDPGEPSQYVDGWPDVLAPGLGWLGRN